MAQQTIVIEVPGTPISELEPTSSVSPNDVLPIVQGEETKKAPLEQVADMVKAGLGSAALKNEADFATPAQVSSVEVSSQQRDDAINERVDTVEFSLTTIANGADASFNAYAEMIAYTPAKANVSVRVNYDPDETKNGTYTWNGTNYTKGFDVIEFIKRLLNANPLYNPFTLAAGDNVDTLSTGIHFVPSDAVAGALLGTLPPLSPPRRGVIISYRRGTTSYQKWIRDTSPTVEVYERSGNGQIWNGGLFSWNQWIKQVTPADILKFDDLKLWISDKLFTSNLIRQTILDTTDLPISSHSSLRTATKTINGVPSVDVVANSASAYKNVASVTYSSNSTQFDNDALAKLKSAGVCSVFIVIEKWMNASVSSSISLVQFDASGATLSNNSVVSDLGVSGNTPKVCSLSNVTVHPDCTRIDFICRFEGTDSAPPSFTVSRPSIAASNCADYYSRTGKSEEIALNFFPNPTLDASNTTLYQASVINDELTMNSGLSQVIYEYPISKYWSVGSTLILAVEAYSDAINSDGVDITVLFIDSNGSTINTLVPTRNTKLSTWEKIIHTATVPANTATVRFRFVKRANSTIGKFRNIFLASDAKGINIVDKFADKSSSGSGFTTAYISPNGSDLNGNGTKTNPFQTIAKAAAGLSEYAVIYCAEGDYDSSAYVNLGKFKHLEIRALANSKVRFLMSPKLTGITKTDGYTNIYEAAWATKPAKWFYIHDVKDERSLISNTERLPWQRGRSHRMTSTRITEIESLSLLDLATTPSWYWENGKIYFNVSMSVSDSLTADIRIPKSINPLVTGGSGEQVLIMSGIQQLYSAGNGFNCTNLSAVQLDECSASFNNGQGIALYDSRYMKISMCEASSNGGDGFNMHRQQPNPREADVTYVNEHCWSHDNYDDGDSMHENCVGFYSSSLFEYNGDRGIATAYGAHAVANGCYARNNGQIFNTLGSTNGEGFAVVGETNPANDTGYGTQMICINCVSENNIQNYSISSAEGRFVSINCISRNALSTGYHKAVAGSIHELQNCSDQGSQTIKSSGVTINNSTLVT